MQCGDHLLDMIYEQSAGNPDGAKLMFDLNPLRLLAIILAALAWVSFSTPSAAQNADLGADLQSDQIRGADLLRDQRATKQKIPQSQECRTRSLPTSPPTQGKDGERADAAQKNTKSRTSNGNDSDSREPDSSKCAKR